MYKIEFLWCLNVLNENWHEKCGWVVDVGGDSLAPRSDNITGKA